MLLYDLSRYQCVAHARRTKNLWLPAPGFMAVTARRHATLSVGMHLLWNVGFLFGKISRKRHATHGLRQCPAPLPYGSKLATEQHSGLLAGHQLALPQHVRSKGIHTT